MMGQTIVRAVPAYSYCIIIVYPARAESVPYNQKGHELSLIKFGNQIISSFYDANWQST